MSKYKVGDEVLVKCEIVGTDDKDGKNHYNVQTEIDVSWVEEDEIVGTEPKEDGIPIIPQEIVEASQNGWVGGYNQGLNDAWEFVNKLWDTPEPIRRKVFGDIFVVDIIKYNTPQDALAKLKAYEGAQSKIEVGDVVTCLDTGEKAMFLGKGECSEIGWFLLKEYDVPQKIAMREVKKTGKHLDISSILEQIGE